MLHLRMWSLIPIWEYTWICQCLMVFYYEIQCHLHISMCCCWLPKTFIVLVWIPNPLFPEYICIIKLVSNNTVVGATCVMVISFFFPVLKCLVFNTQKYASWTFNVMLFKVLRWGGKAGKWISSRSSHLSAFHFFFYGGTLTIFLFTPLVHKAEQNQN